MTEKTCKKCNSEKPISDYYQTKDGYHFGKCKECHKEQVRNWQFKNREKVKTYNARANRKPEAVESRRGRTKEWWKSEAGKEYNKKRCRKRHHADPAYHNLKRAARSAGTEISIRRAVKERDKVCKMCGKSKDLQFDHIFPQSLGGLGTESNLQLLCSTCNLFKRDHLLLPEGGMLILSQDLKERLVGVVS